MWFSSRASKYVVCVWSDKEPLRELGPFCYTVSEDIGRLCGRGMRVVAIGQHTDWGKASHLLHRHSLEHGSGRYHLRLQGDKIWQM